MFKFLAGLFLIMSLSLSTEIFSNEDGSQAVLEKVGGDYVVKKIEKRSQGFFIEFQAETLTGEADIIELHSDHVHFGVTKGSKLRISAEVTKTGNKKIVQAAQVLVYLPAPEGFLPVWLLSKNSRGFEKGSTSYLKMHAPQSDFMVF